MHVLGVPHRRVCTYVCACTCGRLNLFDMHHHAHALKGDPPLVLRGGLAPFRGTLMATVEAAAAEVPVVTLPGKKQKDDPPPPGDDDPDGPPRNKDGSIWCLKCEMWLRDQAQWEDHLIGKKHRKNLMRAVMRANGGAQ